MKKALNKNHPVRNFYEILNGKFSTISYTVSKIKSEFSFEEQCEVIDHLPFSLRKYFYGIVFPEDVNVLGTGTYILESKGLLAELNWFLLTVREYSEELTVFVKEKTIFEHQFMQGYYRDANTTLESIEKRLGTSLWSIESKLLLKEFEKGLDANKLFLSDLTERKGASYISILMDFLSKKAEKERPIHRYQAEFKNFASKSDKESLEYWVFKANEFGLDAIENKSAILAIEHKHALVDRYLSAIKLLQYHFSASAIDKDEKKDFVGRLSYLIKKVGDPVTKKMLTVISEASDIELSDNEVWTIKILDDYTMGRNEQVITGCQQYFKLDSANFDLYLIYCRSLINSNSNFTSIPGNSSLINDILYSMYKLLLKTEDPEIHFRALLKIAYQISSFGLSQSIVNFVSFEIQNDRKYLVKAGFANSLILPATVYLYGNKTSQNKFLVDLSFSIEHSSVTLDFFEALINGDNDAISTLPIPDYRKLSYEAQMEQDNMRYDNAIKIWTFLKGAYQQITYLVQACIENLFICYLKSDKIEEAIRLFVNTYFNNKYYIIRLSSLELEEILRKSKMRDIKIDINLPLFFAIAGSKSTKISNAVEKYLKTFDVLTPVAYISKISPGAIFEPDKEKLIYFLSHVCSISLFTHMVKIKGTKNKLNERLTICLYLLQEDSDNAEIYSREIDDIEHQLLIQEGLQEYDESKIFIDDKKIKDTLLKEFESDFIRYKKYSQIMKNNPGIKFLVGSAMFSIKNKEHIDDETVFSSDPLYDQFKELFLELRDKFLFSQYGLLEFLSARIRHGVFKSEIRPKFEKLELITEKDALTGVYVDNDYWKPKFYNLNTIATSRIFSALGKFSKQIDDLIEEDALKKYLLIRTEHKNKEGWFDYEFDDIYLAVIYSTFSRHMSFDEFVDKCFAFLWERTDTNLKVIQEKLKGEYNDKFDKVILELETSLRMITPEYNIQELFTKINDIKAYVQNDLNRVATWFNRSGKKTKDFSIQKIIEISLQHTNRGYEKKEIELTRKINCNVTFKGEYYPYFIDLIRVFFVNILEHNIPTNGVIPAKLTIELKGKLLDIHITNPTHKTDDPNEKGLTNRFDENRSQTEGKSGFPKVKRILRSYLGKNYSDNHLTARINEMNEFEIICKINIEELVL